MRGLGNHFKDPITLILLILVVVSLLSTWSYVKEAPGLDYYVAWAAADAVNNDTPNNIYDRSSSYKLAVLYRNKADEQKEAPRQKMIAQHRKSLPMTATPFMYWVTGMLAGGDYEKDLTVWHTLSIILLTVSILVMCHILGYSPATSLAILLPVLTIMAPFQSDLRVANVNSVQLGMIGLVLWLQSRSADKRYLFATGLAIGLLAMFKPNLAPIALLLAGGLLVRGLYTMLRTMLYGISAGVFIAVLVSSWWMGSASAWTDWLQVLREIVDGGPGEHGGNYSIMAVVSGGIGPSGQLLLAVAFCLLILAFLWWGRRREPAPAIAEYDEERQVLENTLLIAMGCIVALLASALVWLHYYLLTIPMIIFAFRPWQEPGPMKIVSILMLRVLPAIALLCLLDTEISSLLTGIIEAKTYWVAATMISAITLFVIGLWQLARGISGHREVQQKTLPVAAPASH